MNDTTSHAVDPVFALGRFHAGRAPHIALRPGHDLLPELLSPLRAPERVRYDYPLFVYPPGPDPAGAPRGRLAAPIQELMATTLAAIAPGEKDARALRDNLVRLELAVRQRVEGARAPVDAGEAFRAAAAAMHAELALQGESGRALRLDLDRFIGALPAGGMLLPYDRTAAVRLLWLAFRHRSTECREAFAAEAQRLVTVLEERLEVDRSKRPEGRDASAMGRAMGASGSELLDPSALARTVGTHRGTEAMSEPRRLALEEAVSSLRRWLSVGRRGLSGTAVTRPDTKPPVELPELRTMSSLRPCQAAIQTFDRQAAELVPIVRAARIAAIEEKAGAFDPDVHGSWLAELDWQGLCPEELALVPPVLVLLGAGGEGAQEDIEGTMLPLLRLLFSGRPIQIVVSASPARGPSGVGSGRFEPALVGVGGRHAFVHQTTAARPDHLVRGALRGIEAGCAVYVVAADPDEERSRGAAGWLRAGAAIESRAHPLFTYDVLAGPSWADRMHVDSNPQPDQDWPSQYAGAGPGPSLPGGRPPGAHRCFTFADFALLDPAAASHFARVPDGLPDESLVPVAEYLTSDQGESKRRLPTVVALDSSGASVRLVVSRALARATRECLDDWRSLRELGGVRNPYVERVAATLRDEAGRAASERVAALVREHEAELARIREESVAEAMDSLAAALVSGDPGVLSLAAPPAHRPRLAVSAAPQAAAAPAPAEQATKVEQTSGGFEDPFVDSELCTSCGDCLVVNGVLFAYNGNKQAYITDPASGTYQDLVFAAEKCPAKCIHPGKPRNPGEPGLDALAKRAEPFNR